MSTNVVGNVSFEVSESIDEGNVEFYSNVSNIAIAVIPMKTFYRRLRCLTALVFTVCTDFIRTEIIMRTA